LSVKPNRVLDAGCGEGWLSRALAQHVTEVTGIDGSPELIARAREKGGASFRHLSYDDFIANPGAAGSDYDVVVFNFSLFTEDIVATLSAARTSLRTGGILLLQTIHPFNDAQGEPYADGWREESFASMSGGFKTAMPWYFRTVQSWVNSVIRAGYEVAELREPLDAASGRPLSLLIAGLAV
jgi:2-polyprenyl-3-methyl-5-hydroxy-6-metoxy-1,4-benzoquinol methylase